MRRCSSSFMPINNWMPGQDYQNYGNQPMQYNLFDNYAKDQKGYMGDSIQGTTTMGSVVNPVVIPATGSTLAGEKIAPTMLNNPNFVPGYLKTQIGKNVRVEFLIGTATLTDRTGKLLGVGASYILLKPTDTDDVLMADLYSIKFVTIYH